MGRFWRYFYITLINVHCIEWFLTAQSFRTISNVQCTNDTNGRGGLPSLRNGMDVNELYGGNNLRTVLGAYGLEESGYASAIIASVVGSDGRWASF